MIRIIESRKYMDEMCSAGEREEEYIECVGEKS
jgi:hypothetical protein